jgi:hypothetical protein
MDGFCDEAKRHDVTPASVLLDRALATPRVKAARTNGRSTAL